MLRNVVLICTSELTFTRAQLKRLEISNCDHIGCVLSGNGTLDGIQEEDVADLLIGLNAAQLPLGRIEQQLTSPLCASVAHTRPIIDAMILDWRELTCERGARSCQL